MMDYLSVENISRPPMFNLGNGVIFNLDKLIFARPLTQTAERTIELNFSDGSRTLCSDPTGRIWEAWLSLVEEEECANGVRSRRAGEGEGGGMRQIDLLFRDWASWGRDSFWVRATVSDRDHARLAQGWPLRVHLADVELDPPKRKRRVKVPTCPSTVEPCAEFLEAHRDK